ncbi:MAG: GRP family sugar transporter [Alphaproteobacteria bacterium]|nr:GRP family sugar transporter [Alphaproteobacteria bacterium]
MSPSLMFWLAAVMAIFMAAASSLRIYVDRPSVWLLVLAIGLYTAGNLMMIRVMRESGLAVAMSVSAVLQLVLINLIGLLIFGERPSTMQVGGITLGIVAVTMIVWPQGRQG